MASIGDVTRPAFAYDQATDTWVPVGIGPHSHTASGVGAVATSSFAAKGDLLVGTGAGTLATQTVGANGTVLTADSAEADGVKWAVPAGGKVLQVVEGRTTTGASNSTQTYADTGITATITPSSTSSKILVLISVGGWFKDETSLTESIRFNCMRDATQIQQSGTAGFLRSGSLLIATAGSYAFSLLDTPATTSATTYKVQFKLGAGTGTVYVQDGSSLSTILLLEIGA
jgi:hypothetical protein